MDISRAPRNYVTSSWNPLAKNVTLELFELSLCLINYRQILLYLKVEISNNSIAVVWKVILSSVCRMSRHEGKS